MKPMWRKTYVAATADFYTKITPQKCEGWIQCYYCGLPADTDDHVIPVSYVYKMLQTGVRITSQIVPACRECNALVGDKVFANLQEKTRWLKARLEKRYQDVLMAPGWSSEEILSLGGTLQKTISASLRLKEVIENRLNFCYFETLLDGYDDGRIRRKSKGRKITEPFQPKIPASLTLKSDSQVVLFGATEEDGESWTLGFVKNETEAETWLSTDWFIQPYLWVWHLPIEKTCHWENLSRFLGDRESAS